MSRINIDPKQLVRKRGDRYKEQRRQDKTLELQAVLENRKAELSHVRLHPEIHEDCRGVDPRVCKLLRERRAEIIDESNSEYIVIEQLPTTTRQQQQRNYSRTKIAVNPPKYYSPPTPEPGPSSLAMYLEEERDRKQQMLKQIEEEREEKLNQIKEDNLRNTRSVSVKAIDEIEKKRHQLQYHTIVYYAQLVEKNQITHEQALYKLQTELQCKIQKKDIPYLMKIHRREKERHEILQRQERIDKQQYRHYPLPSSSSSSNFSEKIELPRRRKREIEEEERLLHSLSASV